MTGTHLQGTPRILGRLVGQLVTFGLVALLAGACVSALVAETPEQRAYAAVGEYLIIQEAAVAYVDSPVARSEVVLQIDSLDRQATKIIDQIRVVVRGDGRSRSVIEEERVLEDLSRILNFFRAALVSLLIEAAS